ncbi:MAG TPA: hypothetical protein ENK18_27050 [Deltaproteobacteria bacterium]|nr:hypothetical protein [Deltaproteobacteria bacterium]
MRSPAPVWVALTLFGCTPSPDDGIQIGSLRVDPPPAPPTDFKSLDLASALADAFEIAGVATLATAWAGHTDAMGRGVVGCPDLWIGAPPQDIADINVGDDQVPGLSWADSCQTPAADTFDGFAYWESAIQLTGAEPTGGARSLTMDAQVAAGDGSVLLEFDGEASDSLEGSAYSSSLVARSLSGSLVGFGSGLRGELDVSWSGDEMELFGSIHTNDGFGPPDDRDPDPEDTPELQNLPSWEPGMPRFTSVRFDLQLGGDCALEPQGYVGVRGNEGFWFDVYFLPLYDPEEESAQSNAFPYEAIDNLDCDGIGTIFVRNLDLRAADEGDPEWSREVSIDFAGILASMPTPTLDEFVFTLADLPRETP